MITLGLGSNLGDRKQNLEKAVNTLIHKKILSYPRLSSIYESDALLPEKAPASWNLPYLNMVMSGETSLAPHTLLQETKTIEAELGRQPKQYTRWAPREIDIDILTWGNTVLNEPDLCIPHAELLHRPFVLWPLAEICPNWEYPIPSSDYGKPVYELAKRWKGEMAFKTRKTGMRLSFHDEFPKWVGILNITPDSFSDGGLHSTHSSALKRAEELVESGAHILDIGAESTRPGSQTVPPQEEWERLSPVLKHIRTHMPDTLISVDTRHAEVAQKALEIGVHWINDVSGCDDLIMQKVIASTNAHVVIMHHLGIPPKKEMTLPDDKNSVDVLMTWAKKRIQELEHNGICQNRIIFDPGIGFGKTAEQSLYLIKHCARFHHLGVRLLYGHSRKSFLNLFTKRPFAQRDIETAAVSAHLGRHGVHYLRVHGVDVNARVFDIAKSLYQ